MANTSEKVDFEKLNRLLIQRGVNFNKASVQLGHSSNYLTTSSRKGRLTTPAIQAIKAMYGIDPKEYTIDESPKGGAVNEGELKFSIYALKTLLQRTDPDNMERLCKQWFREILEE